MSALLVLCVGNPPVTDLLSMGEDGLANNKDTRGLPTITPYSTAIRKSDIIISYQECPIVSKKDPRLAWWPFDHPWIQGMRYKFTTVHRYATQYGLSDGQFDISFDVSLRKLLNKHSIGRCIKMF